MSSYRRFFSLWQVFLIMEALVVLTGFWAWHRLSDSLEDYGSFPFLNTLFFIIALLGLQLLLQEFVSKKVSLLTIGYCLLMVPFLRDFWLEETLVFTLFILSLSIILIGKKDLWIIPLLAGALIIFLYFQDTTAFLFPALVMVATYLWYWLSKKKWLYLILCVVAGGTAGIYFSGHLSVFFQPFRDIQPALMIPDKLPYQLGLFVYLLFLFLVLMNRLLSPGMRAVSCIAGMALLILYTFFDMGELTTVMAVMIGMAFLFLYAFWYQQMIFFRSRKTAHFLSALLCGIHLGAYWYQFTIG